MAVLPLYLFSLTPYPNTIHIPILTVHYRNVPIDFNSYDALVVTSKQTVDALEAMGTAWRKLPVLCVAPKTAEKVRECGGRVLESGEGYGEKLEAVIRERFSHLRLLYARPLKTASDFAERLRRSDVAIDDAVVYETRCNEKCTFHVENEAVLAFTSPSAVRCFLHKHEFQAGHRVVVIGASTLAALPEKIRAEMPQSPSLRELVALGHELAFVSGRF